MEQTITIRHAREDDAAALVAIYRPYVLETAVTFEYAVPTVGEFAERIRTISAGYPYLVAECGGRIIGYAYAHRYRERAAYGWTAESSIYIDRDERRSGAGRMLYAALEDCLTRQGVVVVYACIVEPKGDDPYVTRDSVAFHKRMGYTSVGLFNDVGTKFSRWYGTLWMEKRLNDCVSGQGEVIPYPELTDKPY